MVTNDKVIKYFLNNVENNSPTIAKKFKISVYQVNKILDSYLSSKKGCH